mmetsp:Transcript_48464/g.96980  ORF Transcript_48464/g.96980 Transcript_48464/m.96980 type:complete len:201 (-) Transcript_48464:18-620(-)
MLMCSDDERSTDLGFLPVEMARMDWDVLLGDSKPPHLEIGVESDNEVRAIEQFKRTQSQTFRKRYHAAHQVSSCEYTSSARHILPDVPTLDSNELLPSRFMPMLVPKLEVDESAVLNTLTVLVLICSSAMHLLVAHGNDFWAAGIGLTAAGLALEFLSARRLESSRRVAFTTAMPPRQRRRKSSIHGSFVYSSDRSFVLQ